MERVLVNGSACCQRQNANLLKHKKFIYRIHTVMSNKKSLSETFFRRTANLDKFTLFSENKKKMYNHLPE
jgi:hypothetical protein